MKNSDLDISILKVYNICAIQMRVVVRQFRMQKFVTTKQFLKKKCQFNKQYIQLN